MELEKIINSIKICPVIMIFTSINKIGLIKSNIIKLDKYPFFDTNLVYSNYGEVESQLLSQNEYHPHKIDSHSKYKEENDNYFSFEYINESKELILPLHMIEFIEMPNDSEILTFNEFLLDKYSDSDKMHELIQQLLLNTKIPFPVLVKYWARAYTLESNFYRQMNIDLVKKAGNIFDVFIRVLYQGLLNNIIVYFNEKTLYRGALIKLDEIKYIKDSLNKKKENLPGYICYNKAFLSSSLDINIALYFMSQKEPKDNEKRVIYIFEKGENIDTENATNADIQEFSFYNVEREILFFPYSTFEITKIEEKKMSNKDKEINYYEIILNYIGKYKKIIDTSQKIPETRFSKLILSSEVLEKLDMNNESNKNKFDFDLDKFITKDLKTSYINAIYNITDNNLNKKIQLINCDEKLNKEELENICEIYFDNKKIDFTYEYIFNKSGQYSFTFKFNSLLKNANKLFYGCNCLISLDFGKFKSNYLKDMTDMFNGCSELQILDLSNFKAKEVISMERAFKGCNKLKNLDIYDFNTNNVENMSETFSDCTSLTILNLSHFQTNKVKTMFRMFYNCSSLSFINLSNFKLNNAKNINEMFAECSSLDGLNFDLFNLEIKDDIKTENIFYNCNNLKNIIGLKMQSIKPIFYKISEYIRENILTIYQKNENTLKYIYKPEEADEVRTKYLYHLLMCDESLYHLLNKEKYFTKILDIFKYNAKLGKILFDLIAYDYLIFLYKKIYKIKNIEDYEEEFKNLNNLVNNKKFMNLMVEVRNKTINSLLKGNSKMNNNIFKIASIINWAESYSYEIIILQKIFLKLSHKIPSFYEQVEEIISSEQLQNEIFESNSKYNEIINKVFLLCINSILIIITTKEEIYNLTIDDLFYLVNTVKEVFNNISQIEMNLKISSKEIYTLKEISKLFDALLSNNSLNVENIKKIIHYFKEEKNSLMNISEENLNLNLDEFYIYLMNIMPSIPQKNNLYFYKIISSILFEEFKRIENPKFRLNILNKILQKNELIQYSSGIYKRREIRNDENNK